MVKTDNYLECTLNSPKDHLFERWFGGSIKWKCEFNAKYACIADFGKPPRSPNPILRFGSARLNV